MRSTSFSTKTGGGFSREERRVITARCHELDARPDFVPGLARQRYVCVSFTILSLSLVIDRPARAPAAEGLARRRRKVNSNRRSPQEDLFANRLLPAIPVGKSYRFEACLELARASP
jgi:hypothetical protein